jgi:phosphoglycerate kinase
MLKVARNLKPSLLKGKTVLLRVDFNVEIEKGRILDDYRIRVSLPTIQFLIRLRAKPILMSHRGRPKGKEEKYSLRPISQYLAKLLGRRVIFFETWKDLELIWKVVPEGTIGMLENLRFWPGEEKNDAKFAKTLAKLGDLYINDAFSVSHRLNASVDAITKFLPSYAGLLLEKELTVLSKIKQKSQKPFVLIFGGKKLSDKLPLLETFLPRVDAVLTGGGVANTFLAALGFPVGRSFIEKKLLKKAQLMFRKSNSIFLPQDWRTKNDAIFDIGPKTEKLYETIIKKARTILWNGPMGVFEESKFAKGSYRVARSISKNKRAFSVVGGGETVACFRQAITNYQLPITKTHIFLSTGGGAMLEYLAGKKLPGIEALN